MSVWLAILGTWLASILFSHYLGYWVTLPNSQRQSYIHTRSDVSLMSIVFFIALLILHRPIFSMGVTITLIIILSVVNNAKVKALQEPMVFSDFGLFSQVFKYPRLYLPFLHLPTVVALCLLGCISVIGILYLEPSIVSYAGSVLVVDSASAIVIVLLAGWLVYHKQDVELNAEPIADIQHNGFLSSLFFAYYQALQDVKNNDFLNKLKLNTRLQTTEKPPKILPNIIAIQSESFFDARRLSSHIKPQVLREFDKITEESCYAGQVEVAAWGANTMRSEFSFLTGIPSNLLGLHQYNPYQYLPVYHLPSLLKQLKSLGYICIALHPYPAGFFQRERVFKQFGFDEFLDINAFSTAAKTGPYIGDMAVADKIIDVLQCYQAENAQQPIFVFAITMENHGPLHLESIKPEEIEQFVYHEPVEKIHDLIVYLRHLQNADRMLSTLCKTLKAWERPAVVCCYGDHVPSMPDVYHALAYTNANTDYFVWHSKQVEMNFTPQKQIINIAELASLVLATAMLETQEFVN